MYSFLVQKFLVLDPKRKAISCLVRSAWTLLASTTPRFPLPVQVFDVDVCAVDGWGVDPFTRRGILDALPKDAAREGGGVKSRAKIVGDFVTQKLLPALNDRVRRPAGLRSFYVVIQGLRMFFGVGSGFLVAVEDSRSASRLSNFSQLLNLIMFEPGPDPFAIQGSAR